MIGRGEPAQCPQGASFRNRPVRFISKDGAPWYGLIYLVLRWPLYYLLGLMTIRKCLDCGNEFEPRSDDWW